MVNKLYWRGLHRGWPFYYGTEAGLKVQLSYLSNQEWQVLQQRLRPYQGYGWLRRAVYQFWYGLGTWQRVLNAKPSTSSASRARSSVYTRPKPPESYLNPQHKPNYGSVLVQTQTSTGADNAEEPLRMAWAKDKQRLLKLLREGNAKAIRDRYLLLAKRYHPDQVQADAQDTANAIFIELTALCRQERPADEFLAQFSADSMDAESYQFIQQRLEQIRSMFEANQRRWQASMAEIEQKQDEHDKGLERLSGGINELKQAAKRQDEALQRLDKRFKQSDERFKQFDEDLKQNDSILTRLEEIAYKRLRERQQKADMKMPANEQEDIVASPDNGQLSAGFAKR